MPPIANIPVGGPFDLDDDLYDSFTTFTGREADWTTFDNTLIDFLDAAGFDPDQVEDMVVAFREDGTVPGGEIQAAVEAVFSESLELTPRLFVMAFADPFAAYVALRDRFDDRKMERFLDASYDACSGIPFEEGLGMFFADYRVLAREMRELGVKLTDWHVLAWLVAALPGHDEAKMHVVLNGVCTLDEARQVFLGSVSGGRMNNGGVIVEEVEDEDEVAEDVEDAEVVHEGVRVIHEEEEETEEFGDSCYSEEEENGEALILGGAEEEEDADGDEGGEGEKASVEAVEEAGKREKGTREEDSEGMSSEFPGFTVEVSASDEEVVEYDANGHRLFPSLDLTLSMKNAETGEYEEMPRFFAKNKRFTGDDDEWFGFHCRLRDIFEGCGYPRSKLKQVVAQYRIDKTTLVVDEAFTVLSKVIYTQGLAGIPFEIACDAGYGIPGYVALLDRYDVKRMGRFVNVCRKMLGGIEFKGNIDAYISEYQQVHRELAEYDYGLKESHVVALLQEYLPGFSQAKIAISLRYPCSYSDARAILIAATDEF